MITLKKFLEVVNYKITDCDKVGGDVVLDYWDKNIEGVSASIFLDANGNPFKAEVCDYKANRAYRIFLSSSYKLRASDNYALDDIQWIDLETDQDFIEKFTAIVNYKEYDTRIIIQLKLTEQEELLLHRQAHDANKTTNDYIIDILKDYIEWNKFEQELEGNIKSNATLDW